jgi:hypothetical protein
MPVLVLPVPLLLPVLVLPVLLLLKRKDVRIISERTRVENVGINIMLIEFRRVSRQKHGVFSVNME